MSNSKTKVKDFTEGPLLSQIIVFTIPLIFTAVLQLLFNTADTVVVGQYGGESIEARETALAAVGSCGSMINLIVNLFLGLSVGAGVCVAYDIGAQRYDHLEKVVHTAVLSSMICGIGVTVFGVVATRPLLTLMGTAPEVLDEAVPYMIAYFCGMPANMMYNFCASMLRSSGDTVRPLLFLSAAGVVNVGLNLVMVIVFDLGALGVGIATAVSQWVSCILIVAYMMHLDGGCCINFKKLQIDRQVLKRMIVIGLPAGIQGTLFSLSNVLIQSSINSFGKIIVASNTAAVNLEGYIYATQNAVYHAALTFVGQNMGAKKYSRMKKCVFLCIAVVVVVGIVIGMTVLLLGRQLLSLFAPGNEVVINIGMQRLSILASTYFLCGLMEVGCGVMRGLGKSVTPMLVALAGVCLFRILWIYTIFQANHTLFTLYLSYPISWIMTATVHYILCIFTAKKIIRSNNTLPM